MLARLGEIDVALVRDDQIIRLHVLGQHGHRAARHLEGEQLLRRATAAVEPPVRRELHAADTRGVGGLKARRNLAIKTDFENAFRAAHVGKVEIALVIGERRVGGTELVRDELPVLAVYEEHGERHVLRRTALGSGSQTEEDESQ